MARAVGDGLAPQGRADPAPAVDPVEPVAGAAPPPAPPPRDFRALAELFRDRKEMIVYGQLHGHVHPVSFDIGRLEFRPGPGAHKDLPNKVAARLNEWTGQRWIVAVSGEDGAPTLRQQDEAARQRLIGEVARDPLVRAVLDRFEGSEVRNVTGPAAPPGSGSGSHASPDPGGDTA